MNRAMPNNSGDMQQTPKGLRMQIGVFGRRNVGKSSLINAITRQTTSIVSDQAGTTTDPVEKAMELLPIGPVLLIDTAGVDDQQQELGALRVKRTEQVLAKCDLALLVCEPGIWTSYEDDLAARLTSLNKPFIVVINKADRLDSEADFEKARQAIPAALSEHRLVEVSSTGGKAGSVDQLKAAIAAQVPAEFLKNPPIVSDLIKPNGLAVLVVPIDKEAPKGRLILPQVQVIRDLLDAGDTAMVTQVEQLEATLKRLVAPPDLVITDSQAFKAVAKIVPETLPLTSFSVLFARYKGDLQVQLQGARALANIKPGSKVMIAEACTHHPIAEDIGTVKIPNWLNKYAGGPVDITHVQGHDFGDVAGYDLVIHCGACTFNRQAMQQRIRQCQKQNVPITNYGLAIAFMLGILERAAACFTTARP